MDRRFTFSNDEVIKLLQTKLIPAVGNTHELQNQHFESSKWFMDMAAKVNPRVTGGVTAQGFYVAGADGKGYAFNNNRDPERVLDFLKRGMAGFQKDPPSQVEVSDAMVKAQFTHGPDPSVSVLQVYSRIKPLPESCDELNRNIGRDFLWAYPEDVQTIRAGQVPKDFVRRMVRYNLVDNVRGEPNMWSPEQIQTSDFSIKRVGDNRFALDGTFSMAAGERGLTGAFSSLITLDAKQDRITGFKGFARTEAWGAGTYTPNPPPGRFSLLFAIVPATADYAKDTPPAAALYGDWDYRKPK